MKKRDHSTFLSKLLVDGESFSVYCSGKDHKETNIGTFNTQEDFQLAVARHAVAKDLTVVNVRLASKGESQDYSFSVRVQMDLIAQ